MAQFLDRSPTLNMPFLVARTKCQMEPQRYEKDRVFWSDFQSWLPDEKSDL